MWETAELKRSCRKGLFSKHISTILAYFRKTSVTSHKSILCLRTWNLVWITNAKQANFQVIRWAVTYSTVALPKRNNNNNYYSINREHSWNKDLMQKLLNFPDAISTFFWMSNLGCPSRCFISRKNHWRSSLGDSISSKLGLFSTSPLMCGTWNQRKSVLLGEMFCHLGDKSNCG